MGDEQDLSDVSQDEETYAVEQTWRFQANLAALQEGTLTNEYWNIHNTLVQIGKRQIKEASSLVARFLTSDDPDLRDVALMVLTLDLGLQEYLDPALRFLLEDPDPYCRICGACAVGSLMQNTNDHRMLAVFTRTALNEQEDGQVRSSAYRAILPVIGSSNLEQFIASHEYPKNVDWQLVASFLEQE